MGGDDVAVEAIDKVKEAENSAEKLIADAKQRAAQIINEANLKAREERKKIKEEEDLKNSQTLKAAREEGQNKSEPILKMAKRESGKIKNISDEDLDSIVDKIVKRLVENGNS